MLDVHSAEAESSGHIHPCLDHQVRLGTNGTSLTDRYGGTTDTVAPPVPTGPWARRRAPGTAPPRT